MLKNILIIFCSIFLLLIISYNYIIPTFFGQYFENKYPEIKMYNSDYIKEEIKFGEEKVFPNAGTPEKMIAMFAESLKNKNKLTTKLLSTPEFPTIPPELWNEQFNKFWEKYQGQEITYSAIKYNREGGCQKGFEISTKDKTVDKKFICVNKAHYGWENRDQIFNDFKSYYALSLVWEDIKRVD